MRPANTFYKLTDNMRYSNIALPLIIINLFAFAAQAQPASDLHKKAIVVDTHGDILSDQIRSGIDVGTRQPKGNFDLFRAREGGLDVQVFSVWSDDKGDFKLANRQIDSLQALIRRHPNLIQQVRTSKELKNAIKKGKMAALFGVEGGHMIEGRLDYLDSLAERGMTYMTLTWNNSTPWASSAADETNNKTSLKQVGLSDQGKSIIKRMNELGVIVDLSHVGEQTFYDAIKASAKPVMASHSSAWKFNHHSRNLKDEQIKAIADNGGVIFVNFYSGFLDSTYSRKQKEYNQRHAGELAKLTDTYKSKSKAQAEIDQRYRSELEAMRAPLSLLIDHIDHMVKLTSADHVGLGADYDGAESYPAMLDDVSGYPHVTEALLKRGYSGKDVMKILGGNFIRLLKANKGE